MKSDDIDSDPQRYREEWFDVDLSLQKEFKLPNLSSPLFNGSNLSSLRSYSPSGLIITRNQPQVQLSDSFPFHPSGSQFLNSVTNNHWSCPNQQSNLNNFNETTTNHISSTPVHGPDWSSTSSEPMTSIKKEPKTLVPNYQNLIKPKQEIQEINCEDQEHGRRLIKTSASEPQSDDSESGDRRCFACDLTFASGSALGGHMSYHARKRKMEVMKNGGKSVFRADVDGPFEDKEEDTRADVA
ncbi:hypothetical protein ACOSP7_017401 [Xanthoceras sorbifolium]